MHAAPQIRRSVRGGALLAASLLAAMPGRAAAVDLSANAGLVSDYRFRGLSLSRRKPAVQGGIDLGLSGGWYAGTWGSSIANYSGSHVEVDLFGGRSGSIAGFDYSVTAAAYFYPKGTRVDYGELQVQVSRAMGPLTLEVEADYVPDQHNTATSNTYLGASVELPLGDLPLSLKLRGGYEDGFYRHKLDWEAGLALAGEHLAAAVSVVGSNYGAAAEAGRLARTSLKVAVSTRF